MLNFLISFLFVIFCLFNEIECLKTPIQDLLPGYYESETVQQFKEDWKKYQNAFDNAIETGLQEDFGTPAVNIYEKNRQNRHVLGSGFTITDGVVRVYLYEFVLRQVPSLLRPRLNLSLPDNHAKFESRLGRVFIDSTYYVARNRSAETYARLEDQKDISPFSLQQVDRQGNVTIIADNCLLSGIAILTLLADSVNLGHTPVRVTDCKFMVEISTQNSGAPPVIAPYFTQHAKEKLELMMSKPIREELQTKLQGALYSYVNTSVLFGPENVHNFRKNQRGLFKSYAKFIVDYVSNMNKNTLKANKGTTTLKGFNMVTDVAEGSSCHLSLKDLKLHGLETAYAARSGGPYRDDSSTTATEAIVFSSMQIHGTGVHEDGSGKKENNVAVEIRDTAVSLTISIENGKTKIVNLQLMGWRSFEFSINGWCLNPQERIGYQSLVYGHILNELPVRIINHLTGILGALPNKGELPNDRESLNDDQSPNDEQTPNDEESLNDKKSPNDDGLSSDKNQKLTENEKSSEEKTNKGNEKPEKKPSSQFFSDVGTFFSDGVKENFFSDKAEKNFFSDKLDDNFFSDKAEKNFFSDKAEEQFFSDKLDDNFFSDKPEKPFFSDKPEKPFFSDKVEKNFFSDNMDKTFLSDKLDANFFSGETNNNEQDYTLTGGSGTDKKTSNGKDDSNDGNRSEADGKRDETDQENNENHSSSGSYEKDVENGSHDDDDDETNKKTTETEDNKNDDNSGNNDKYVENDSDEDEKQNGTDDTGNDTNKDIQSGNSGKDDNNSNNLNDDDKAENVRVDIDGQKYIFNKGNSKVVKKNDKITHILKQHVTNSSESRRITTNDKNIPKRKSGNKKRLKNIKRNRNDSIRKRYTTLKHANKKKSDRRNVEVKVGTSQKRSHSNVRNAHNRSNLHMSENEVR